MKCPYCESDQIGEIDDWDCVVCEKCLRKFLVNQTGHLIFTGVRFMEEAKK
jgi:hypothetical protein